MPESETARDFAARLRATLADIAEPLRTQERQLEARITELERELAELRPFRTEIRRQLRAITGEPAKNLDGKPAVRAVGGRQRAKPIGSTKGGRKISELAFRLLRERGVIVLDHLAQELGRAKHYKLVPSPEAMRAKLNREVAR
jgi:hypothetical protein